MQTQCLKLADDLFDAVRRGGQTVTVRVGRRDIALAPLVFEPVSGRHNGLEVDVLRVTYCRAADISQADAEADGAAGTEELIEALKRFYPDLTPVTEVTVVEFAY